MKSKAANVLLLSIATLVITIISCQEASNLQQLKAKHKDLLTSTGAKTFEQQVKKITERAIKEPGSSGPYRSFLCHLVAVERANKKTGASKDVLPEVTKCEYKPTTTDTAVGTEAKFVIDFTYGSGKGGKKAVKCTGVAATLIARPHSMSTFEQNKGVDKCK